MLTLTLSLVAAVAALPPLHPSEKVTLDSRQYAESLVEYRAHPSLDPSGQILEGLLIHDRRYNINRKSPAIVIFHSVLGRTEYENNVGRYLASLGYTVLVSDLYGKNMAPPDVEGNFAIMLGLLDNRTTVLRGRVLAAWNAINALDFVDKQRIGSIGFCYGGISTLDLARFNVGLTTAVTMFGSLTNYPDPRSNATRITASIQVHHGDIDKYTKNEDVEAFLKEMRARRADWWLLRYADSEHGFAQPGVENLGIPNAKFNPISARRCWEATEVFLAEKLKPSRLN